MRKAIKNARIYLVFAAVVIGYYAYCAVSGIAFWESSSITRNSDYNNSGSRVRGSHSFYHK